MNAGRMSSPEKVKCVIVPPKVLYIVAGGVDPGLGRLQDPKQSCGRRWVPDLGHQRAQD